MSDDWRELNRRWWNERAPLHVTSAFYNVAGFRQGGLSLQEFEPAEMGDVRGKDLLHLQCHFGMDTMSWARLGARATGLDFSEPAVQAATALATELGLDASFVLSDLYDAQAALAGRTFDVVYTGVGAVCWLPDLTTWAQMIHDFLRPGGTFYIVETHPMSDVLGDEDLMARFPYFHTEGQVDDSPGTYAMPEGPAFTHNRTHWWIHSLSEVFNVLVGAGLTIELFNEHRHTAFARWPFMTRDDKGRYWLPDDMPALPLLYSLRARRTA